MEEKKLTDEEIVKAWDVCYNSPCCNADCPYFNKNGRNLCLENKAFYRDMKRIAEEYVKQKAEIERLTEENAILKENPPILAGRSLGKTIRAKLLAFDKMKEQNDELQKQVDELRKRLIDEFEAFKVEAYGKVKQQAVKDTAKEIFSFIVNQYDGEYFLHNVEQFIAEKYGVEVE